MVQIYCIRLKVREISCHHDSQGAKDTRDEGESIHVDC
jgi:hypothetical protein